ncbi:unnamed protein product [Mytilus coruscus]|uniref:Reverse transcriptase domain-containing protein n=1 Tax=Mytilus coruscus TaxID=42192 RepID=A0A6J8DRY5_MYTCO|nr:unnamed protein product [Mytilus coruscus]
MEVLPEANECVNANKYEIVGEKGSGLQIECKRINDPKLLNSFGLQKGGLKIANLNIQHILPKIEEIRLTLNEKKSLHILGLCETFLNPELGDNLIEVKGYDIIRGDRHETQDKTGGGIHNGVITETQHIVDAFNKHFINIAPKDSLSTSQSYKFDSNKTYEEVAGKVPQDTWFYIPLITVAEVKDCLSNLNVAKATGIDQFQHVENGTMKSRALEKKSVVPQGSILGSLLFLLFINDLPLHITSSQADLYADDTTIHCTGHSLNTIQDSITNDLDRIEDWCKGNKMYINPTKTTSMIIGSRQKLAKTDHVLNLTVGNSHIRDVNGEKLLGVFIDENLEWTAQIDTLCTKISTRLNLLSRIKKSLPLETRKLYFNGYILPILDYCCTIWGNTCDQNTNRLDKLQKRAARIILELPYDTPSNTMFKKLSWLRFTDRVIYHKALYVHTCLYGSVPEYLSNKISNVTNKNGMQLRSNTTQLLNIPKARTNTFRRSFFIFWPNFME